MSAELPLRWKAIRLEELVSARKGKKSNETRAAPSQGFVPNLDIQAIEKGIVRGYAEAASSRLGTTEDLLVVWDGARSGWVGLGREGAIGSTIMALRPKACDRAYIYRWLQSQFRHVNTNTRGTGIPHVDPEVFWNLEVPLAPAAEQRRIVAKLEEMLGRVDACNARLAKIPVLLKRFRQSVLAAACSGRLTADWRKEKTCAETGTDRLSKVLDIRAESWRRSGRKGGPPKPVEPDVDNLPDLPPSWTWIPLGILGKNPFATVQTGPFGALLHRDEFTSDGVPVVAVGNLTGMGFTKDGLYFVSAKKAQQLSRFDIQAGDVLFARSGATLGKVCVAPPDAKDWRMTGHILRARLNHSVLLPDFCVFALRGDPAVTRQVFGSVQGTTRPGYNTTLLESISLPIAPLPEQQEIVRRVESLFALADKIEARYVKAQAQVDRLTPALLARAFAGKLVAQNPADEPASMLLQRIRAQEQPVQRRNVLKLEFTEPAPVAARLAHTKGIFYRRAALDCYVISALAGDANLGRTKLEKISHLLEYECGLPLEREPIRDAAGPNDYPSRLKVESMARKQAWYFASKQPDGLKIDYRPGPAMGKSLQTAAHFIGDQKEKVDALLALMRPLDTRQSEIVATLYASWNDFLLAGKVPTDDELVDDVRHHWHPKKQLIPVELWTKTLAWMRRKQLVPRGSGRPVRPGKVA